jgi:hypothetical protein
LFSNRGFITSESSCFLLNILLLDSDILEPYSRNSKPISFFSFCYIPLVFFDSLKTNWLYTRIFERILDYINNKNIISDKKKF